MKHEQDTAQADKALLIDVVRAVLDRNGGQRWVVRPETGWCYVHPPDYPMRAHGWKLHVSATALSAPLVLARSAEVLVRADCSFKFGTDIPRVIELNGAWYQRGAGGKFVTVYPRDDEHFRQLAVSLHEATSGIAGPEILSDQPYRPGSLVHYRYGGINGQRVFTDDGISEHRMIGPDGTVVTDERLAWFMPPPWASSPFDEQPIEVAEAPESLLLDGRFRVSKAIRHANKGGVFLAMDEHDGREVVVKQARANVAAGLDGRDVRDRLRDEARMLDVLGPLGVVPHKITVFEQQRDLFLAQELVSGDALSDWAVDRSTGSGDQVKQALTVALGLARAVVAVHRAGYVLRDLKPQNVMVTKDTEIRLIDVEFAVPQGEDTPVVGTRGFMAPEVSDAMNRGGNHAATAALDCFGLGVTMFCALTASSPMLISGQPRGVRDLIISELVRHTPVLGPFAELVLGLTEVSPVERWTLPEAITYLDRFGDPSTVRLSPREPLPSERVRLATGVLDELLADGLTDLVDRMTPHRPALWPPDAGESGERDASTAWSGAAGILAVLTRATAAKPSEARLRQAVEIAAHWLGERVLQVPRVLPGLGFGRAGTAWALYDAAQLIGDQHLSERAIGLAMRLPTDGPSPDLTHGLSGAGLAHLHLAGLTGDAELTRRTSVLADGVVNAAVRRDQTWTWPTAPEADSMLAGSNVYGLAHGVAGAGLFLLGAALSGADSDAKYLEAARGAGETLLEAAGAKDGSISWPRAVDSTEHTVTGQWCGGPAGIGVFVLRLGMATNDQRYIDLAHRCAAAVMTDPWRLTTGACCGLAGAGQFLLDLAQYSGREVYRDHATRLAGVLKLQLWADDRAETARHRGTDSSYAYGSAGVLGFLVRLRYGGPAPWMPRILTAAAGS
ncbi:class IV lanthionine synthetase LanL [Kribbella deserti]|uniref:non-specific serine/threonine protein kinase n=1 Tax=Kribbella deserti TaxID=1926257 RepID=A0ABV6QPU3_9ACTN